MNAYHVIDEAAWPRRDLFQFYQRFANPCFNVSVSLGAQPLYDRAKDEGVSFFQLVLYAILRAANSVPQVRQRIVDGAIVEFERIAVMTPIMTGQEMFRQVWCEYAPTFDVFAADITPKIDAAKQGVPAPMDGDHGEDYLCASCVPWLHFTSVTQADYFVSQAAPILAWGKMKDGVVPFSCKFHHAFVDGLHVGRFFGCIEECLEKPEVLWREVEGG